MATTQANYGLIGHSAESTAVKLHFPPINAGGTNFANLFDNGTGRLDLVKAEMDNITLLNHTRTTASILAEASPGSLPTDPNAQREIALRFIYSDNVTGEKYRFDIPGPDPTLRTIGTDECDLSQTVIADFVDAFEANCVSPDNNAVTVQRAYFVGRNS